MLDSDLQEIIDCYLCDALTKLSLETQKHIVYNIIDISKPNSQHVARIECKKAESEANIEIRFYRFYDSRPTRFRIQAMTSDLSQETGYSGFIIKGRLTSPTGVTIYSRVNTYNVHDWQDELKLS